LQRSGKWRTYLCREAKSKTVACFGSLCFSFRFLSIWFFLFFCFLSVQCLLVFISVFSPSLFTSGSLSLFCLLSFSVCCSSVRLFFFFFDPVLFSVGLISKPGFLCVSHLSLFFFFCSVLVSTVIFSWNALFLVQLLLKMELWSCYWSRSRGRAAGIQRSPLLFFTSVGSSPSVFSPVPCFFILLCLVRSSGFSLLVPVFLLPLVFLWFFYSLSPWVFLLLPISGFYKARESPLFVPKHVHPCLRKNRGLTVLARLLVTITWPFGKVSWRIVGSWGKSRGWLSLAHFPGFSCWIGHPLTKKMTMNSDSKTKSMAIFNLAP